jgi:two-component system sensor histidine kinase KdpD
MAAVPVRRPEKTEERGRSRFKLLACAPGKLLPDWVFDRADEIRAGHAHGRGDIYPQERIERAFSNFFRRGNLIALPELALHRVTREVDRTLEDYVQREKLSGNWR